MKNGANRTNKIRSDKIQENGRTELPTEKCGQTEARKENLSKNPRKEKMRAKKSGYKPSLKLKDVSTGLDNLIEIGRSQNKQKIRSKKDLIGFRRRDDVHAIFIRSLVYSRYRQEKNFIYTTRKKRH